MGFYNYTYNGDTYKNRKAAKNTAGENWKDVTSSLSKTGKTVSSIGNVVSSITGAMSNMNGSISAEAGAAREGMRSAIGQFGPWGAVISAASGIVDSITDATGISWNTIDKDDALRAGIGKGAIAANNILASIPGNSIWGAILGKTKQAQKSVYIDQMANSYGGSVQDINSAMNLSGKRAFGVGKMNSFIDEQNRVNNLITNIAMQSELAKNNNAAELYQQQNFNKYSGYMPQLLLAKKGSKIPELEVARTIIAGFNKTEIESFKSGGKLDMNIIPEGALHKNKHHLEEINPELEGTITEKGIPVITTDGEQKAEIEKEEIVFKKSTTEQLEEYYDQYNNSKDDSIAIECGKFLVEEILKRTEDRTGLLKTVSDE